MKSAPTPPVGKPVEESLSLSMNTWFQLPTGEKVAW